MCEALSTAVAGLSPGRSLKVLAPAAAFRIAIDDIGVPRLSPATAAPGPDDDVLLIDTTPEEADALRRLRAAHPDAPVLIANGADLDELLAQAVAAVPIRHAHGLLAARVDPATGQIRLTSRVLFEACSRQGDVATLTVHSEAEHDLVFAVITSDGATPVLLSAWSAPMRPGPHRVTARLRGPGDVEFLSPTGLVPDQRSVAELMDAIPAALGPVEPVHLICAIEVSGPAARVATRLDCAEKVIRTAQRRLPLPGTLRVGLLAYGGHRFDRHGVIVTDRQGRREDVIVTDWLASPQEALASLGWLGAADLGYPRAAQIEDMLATVVHRLDAARRPQRTTLLVIGDRPPHPPALNREVAPCPRGHDWQRLLSDLERRPHVTLAAVRDQPGSPGGAAWARLGATALKPLDTVDPHALGVQLGLIAPTLRRLPVPLVDEPA
ncbi:hypothetical protein ABZW11_30915 [Nonomuraea sp. NPDC004580]|uniref:hypothetical protein n=1 Tax=Nonomuraea sp. NPDC004580 TaxID=3154552 RepID=UPI0033AA6F9C